MRGNDTKDDQNGWFDVAVLVEREVTGTAARRMVELYQMKSAPLRYNLVRSRLATPETEADQLMQKSLERLESLGVEVTGTVTDQEPIEALADLVGVTSSEEAVVVTDRHRVAEMFRRDLASQARTRLDLPLFHLVNR
ncbi:hypothetical protein EV138_5729 [Kribbella voronezhensis]|uniref:Universal stress protein family protein n=1 Tax=Kribbella voronezhensis TaxID=2512212 RepID=A0A4R7SXR7_9ACTN|nr:hypothetical protein [Kribbella voronezhensis]TDU83267.1 hypothetical protein EV138_5729 [Kribbella voronezhensis]